MSVTELVRFPEEAILKGKDGNRLVDLVLGNDAAQRRWVGWDGVAKDPNTGATVTTGGYSDYLQNTGGNHVAVIAGATSATAVPTPTNAVMLVQDAGLSVGRGVEVRLYNAAGTNEGSLKHSGTNGHIKTDDSQQIATALNVGPAIVATAAGDASIQGTLSIATLGVAGNLTVEGVAQFNGNVGIGNAVTNTLTVIALSRWQDAAGTTTPLYVDTGNNRAQFGSVTPLGSAANSKVEVIGGRVYVAAGNEQQAIGVRYGLATGTFFIGATNTADPSMVFLDNGAGEVIRFNNNTDTFQVQVTGKLTATQSVTADEDVIAGDRAVVNATAWFGSESFRVAAGTSRFEGLVTVTADGMNVTGGIVLASSGNIDGNAGVAGQIRIGSGIFNAANLIGSEKLYVNGIALTANNTGFATRESGGTARVIANVDASNVIQIGNVALSYAEVKAFNSVKLMANATSRFEVSDVGIGFFASTPIAKPAATGSRGGNAALASLLSELANFGLITDSTTA